MTLLALSRPLRSPASWIALLGIAVTGVFAIAVILTMPDELSAPSPTAATRAAAPAGPAAAIPAVPPQLFESITPEQAVTLNAAVPISSLPNPAAAPFKLSDVSEFDRARAVNCLAMAVYYEAANQGDTGEAAVAQVVLNRMRNPLFPKTVCGVVFQGSGQSTGCQFTFTCDGSLSRQPSADGWRQAKLVAERALGGFVQKDVGEATHYHTMWVVPYWQPTVLKVAQIGAHIFYRWNGDLGRPAAFTGAYAGSEPITPTPAGFTAQDLATMQPPIALAAPIALAQTQASDTATGETEPKPEIKIVATASAGAPAPMIAPAADAPQIVAPNQFFGSDNARPHRLPMAAR
jgi:spore germination cell wall hydrolase CwlJ-like protein